MSPFECYQIYTALKLHFTTPNYDFFKYNGKSGANFDSFSRRKDKFQYAKLAKQRDPLHFIVANFVSENPPKWIGDINTEEAGERYLQFVARTQSLTYRFNSEIRGLKKPFAALFKIKGGQHPELLNVFKQDGLSIESLVLLNNYLNFIPLWDEKIQDPILWPSIKQKCLKYQPFVKYDKEKIKQIIYDVISEDKIYNMSSKDDNTSNI